MMNFSERLGQLRALSPGWDSYDAAPPSETACDVAERLLHLLEMNCLSVDSLVPTSDGGLLLQHGTNGKRISWEIDDDGEIGVLVQKPGGEPVPLSPE